jgi:hypothetical protein
MAKSLKTPGECMDCGAAVPLKRLSDSGRTRCQQCLEDRHWFTRASWKAEDAKREYRGAPEIDPEAVSAKDLAAYLRSAAASILAAAYACEAVGRGPKSYSPAALRKWMAWAKRRAEWGKGLANSTLKEFDPARAAIAHGLEVIPGEAEEPPSVKTATRLSLVRDDAE